MLSFFVVDLDGVVVVGSTASFSPSSSSSMMTMGIKCSVSVPSGGPPGGPLPRGLERLPAWGDTQMIKTLHPNPQRPQTLFGGRTTLPRQSAEYSLRGYMQFGRSAAREYGSVLGR